jgi:hypothetical protein
MELNYDLFSVRRNKLQRKLLGHKGTGHEEINCRGNYLGIRELSMNVWIEKICCVEIFELYSSVNINKVIKLAHWDNYAIV